MSTNISFNPVNQICLKIKLAEKSFWELASKKGKRYVEWQKALCLS
jgi:hypothetical protein